MLSKAFHDLKREMEDATLFTVQSGDILAIETDASEYAIAATLEPEQPTSGVFSHEPSISA